MSTSLKKAREKIDRYKKSAATARAKLRETDSPMGIASGEAPAVLSGGVLTGLLRRQGVTEVLGAPTDVVVAVGAAAAGWATGSPFLMRHALGAGAVAVDRYMQELDIGAFGAGGGETE